MGLIYHHSFLNLAATDSPDGDCGLFVDRNGILQRPISVSLKSENDSENKKYEARELPDGDYYLVDTNTWRNGVDGAPLNKRGWVAQERALSPRTLHFGRQQLFWECSKTNATEVCPAGLLSGTEITDPKIFLESGDKESERREKKLQDRLSISDTTTHVQSLPIRGMRLELQQWASMVQLYSTCALTFSTDKLVAISGMAQLLAPKLRCDYLAGLWRKDLEHQLLWKLSSPARAAPKKDGTRGPSWSWSSVDGDVKIPDWKGYSSG